MEATGPGIKPVENETVGRATRTTSDGRRLLYELNVLQQPLRARACGSGAKSSADRRPVDPPPIVELKVLEQGENDTRDITFKINANYFLFATLEQARIIAPGRMNDGESRGTVLTGTPVAGMVLLDRPKPAGYFIFPDLSVRHEGKYRLAFSLYEELKEPQDADQHDELAKQNGPDNAHVTHRLEVKSAPFQVYSAKKFPGLTESTSLSRIVAEQGCRVRIRRDVRMRRRDQKTGKDWDGYEDDTVEARVRMSATPEISGYPGLSTPHHYMESVSRPRSSSNASHHSLAPSLSVARRPSLQDLNQSYSQPAYGSAPHTPQTAYPQPSPYGPSPTHNYGPTPFMHQQSMQPPPPQYQQSSYQQQPQLPPSAPSQPNYYSYGPSSTSQSQVAPGAQAYEPQRYQRSSADYSMSTAGDSRRPSVPFGAPPPTSNVPRYPFPNTSESSSPSGYQAQSQATYSSQHGHQPYGSSDQYNHRNALPEPVQPPTRLDLPLPPISSRPFSNERPPSLNTQFNSNSSKQLEPESPLSAVPQNGYFGAVQTSSDSHKRGFSDVFNNRHLYQPLKQGARQGTPGQLDYTPHYHNGTDVESGDHDPHQLKMVYKRSDGTTQERVMPAHHHYA